MTVVVLVGLDDKIAGQGGFVRGDGEAPDPDIEERGAAGNTGNGSLSLALIDRHHGDPCSAINTHHTQESETN